MVADRYAGAFSELYGSLADFPGIGAPRPSLGAQTRRHVRPYVIIYDYIEDDEEVTVLRILHGSRKITRDLMSG